MRAPTVISPGWKKLTSPFCPAPAASKGAAYQYLGGPGSTCPSASLPTALNASFPPIAAVLCEGVTSTETTLDGSFDCSSGSRGFCAVTGKARKSTQNKAEPKKAVWRGWNDGMNTPPRCA